MQPQKSRLWDIARMASQIGQVQQSQLSDVARMAGQIGQVQQSRLSDVTRMASQIGQVQQSRLSDVARMAGQIGQVQQSRLSDVARMASQIGQVQQSRLSDVARMASQIGQVQQSQLSDISPMVRWIAQAQIAEGAPALKEGRFSSNARQIKFYLDYLVYTVPSVTWEWINNHPIATEILVAILLWLTPPPYELINDNSTRKEIDREVRKFVVPPQLELRISPSSSGIVKDTLYHNNTVEKIDENGPWMKIEYQDRIEGKTKEGWVLRYYLDSGE